MNDPAAAAPRLADRLAAARHGRFVGREAELALFRAALQTAEPPFAVLHLHGPGGVGKTTLLREYARLAAEQGRPVVRLDGRNIDPSPPGFLRALRQALGLADDDTPPVMPNWPPAGVLLIDTYESLAPLDVWLRETLLPQLPARGLVVIAGRRPPAPAWRTDLDWAALTRITPLRNLRPEECRTYLVARGIPPDQHPAVLAFTHGHPLALALVADAVGRGDTLAAFDPRDKPDVVHALLERLVQDVPSADHRLALDVCVRVWATTEPLLAAALGTADAHDLFAWLRQLSFIEQGPYGLFPHDLAREALDAESRWRDPDGQRRLNQRLTAFLHDRVRRARGVEQQRIWFDLLYLSRQNPFMRPYFEWAAMGDAYAEPAAPRDHEPIVAMVRRHEGDASARIAQHWLQRQPETFLVYRTLGGDLLGFMAHLALRRVTPEDLATDPAVSAALDYARRHGPVGPGEEIAHLRFWMSREAHQGVSAALNLTAINCSIHWTTRPELAWNFIATVDPEFMAPHFTSVHMWRAPEADFAVGGRRYGVFAHDWRVEPAAAWLNVKAELAAPDAPGPPPRDPASPAAPALARAAFAAAVRQALRDYRRPDRLATNPLARSRLVGSATGRDAVAVRLQSLLREAVDPLAASPKDLKFHRAIWHTYIEPASTQERAAELLALPFNTYRYHLAGGLERVTEWLWQRECHADR